MNKWLLSIEALAKLGQSEKSMILAIPCQNRQAQLAGSYGGGEDILQRVDEPPPWQGAPKGRFFTRLSFAIASMLLVPYLLFSAEEKTLSIIKPDAVKSKHIGAIISRFEQNGLKIAGMKMVKLSHEKAKIFYQEHQEKPFFAELSQFMTSGPIVVMVLSGPDAISKNRELMGATDLKKAAPGTLRKDFATSITENAVHGSDSKESAEREIAFFFTSEEIVN